MVLNNSNIITEPDRDFKNIVGGASVIPPGRGEQTGKRVPHDVRGDVRAALIGHVAPKVVLEIVTVKTAAVFDFRVQHVGFAQFVAGEELGELIGHGEAAFLFVFELNVLVFAQMDLAVGQVEPKRFCFDDFLLAQPGMETTKQNELQIFARTFGDKFFNQLRRAKVAARPGCHAFDLQTLTGIGSANLFNFPAPSKKRADGGQVAGCRVGGKPQTQLLLIKIMNQFGRDFGRRAIGESGKLFQNSALGFNAGGRVTVQVAFMLKKWRHPIRQRSFAAGNGFAGQLVGPAQGFVKFICAQRHIAADSVDLPGEPVKPAALVKSGEMFHACKIVTPLSHCQGLGRFMAVNGLLKWCAVQGLNLRPLPCQGSCPKAECNTRNVTLLNRKGIGR